MASKTASSVLGKKVMKSIVNEETVALLGTIKKIVKTESGSAKKAEDLEKNLTKITFKCYKLLEANEIDVAVFLSADRLVRDAFELLVRIYNGKDRVSQDKIKEALKKVESLLKSSEEILLQLLTTNLSSKNVLRLSFIFSTLGDAKFLENVLEDPSLAQELEKVISVMEAYTQVQYH
eukprot:TRINITY_DN2401_c0_g1_i2.p1 TRINITY_DN2401_c0_g1~~TRINITY_DN2401_c0_g1_i2.p1  ORF type:complete len:178 (-),score=49.46 TRINITY_DN2401_c0_g1_i2:112-645(-)